MSEKPAAPDYQKKDLTRATAEPSVRIISALPGLVSVPPGGEGTLTATVRFQLTADTQKVAGQLTVQSDDNADPIAENMEPTSGNQGTIKLHPSTPNKIYDLDVWVDKGGTTHAFQTYPSPITTAAATVLNTGRLMAMNATGTG